MRYSYWSSSKLAVWIRGTEEPYSASFEDWDEWEESMESERPWRHWVADKLLNKIQDIVYWPINFYEKSGCYIRNRFFDKPHIIQIEGFEPGHWYEYDARILYGCFTVLNEYVESETIEKLEAESNMFLGEFWNMDPDNPDYYNECPHAVSAKEVLDLYNWWKSFDEYTIGDDDGDAKIEEMLIRLMKIRTFLWN